MRRVVITGYGIVSCLGNDKATVIDALRNGKSGIRFKEEYKDMGMRSHVAGSVDIDLEAHIDRKVMRFMGDAAAYSYIAMQQAIEDSGLSEDQVSNERTGIIMGSGGASSFNQVEAADILREKGLKRVGPFRVPRVMASTVSACLATPFKIRGLNYSISSACATSTHCIGNAFTPKASRLFAALIQISIFRDANTTFAPASARPVAIYFPMPLPPPVTIATLSLSLNNSWTLI